MEPNSNENRNTNPFTNRPGIILLRKPQDTSQNNTEQIKYQENSGIISPITNIPPQQAQQGIKPVENHQNDQLPIDDVILQLLSSPQKRLFALKLDLELERFLKQTESNKLEFPPLDSYQRLVVHRVAQYFKLDHAVIGPVVNNNRRAVVLFKRPDSQIPTLRFTDLIEQEEPKNVKIQILTRSQQENKPAIVNKPVLLTRKITENPSLASKSLEQREEDYAKARARIFNGFEPNDNSSSPESELESTPENSTPNPSLSENQNHTPNKNELSSVSPNIPSHPTNDSHSPQKNERKSSPLTSPVPSPTGSLKKRPSITENPEKYESNENASQKCNFNNQTQSSTISPVSSPNSVDLLSKNLKNNLKLSNTDGYDLIHRNGNNSAANQNYWRRDFDEAPSQQGESQNYSNWHPSSNPMSPNYSGNTFSQGSGAGAIPRNNNHDEFSHRSYSDSNIIRPNFIPSDPIHCSPMNYAPPPPLRWPGAPISPGPGPGDSNPHWGVSPFPPGPAGRNDFPSPYSPTSKIGAPPHDHFPPPAAHRDHFPSFNPPPSAHDRNYFYPPPPPQQQGRGNEFPVYVYHPTPWSNPTQPRLAHDYERPKPKSTQLYDPNATQDNYAHPSPHSPGISMSPTFMHPPFEPQYTRPLNDQPIPLNRGGGAPQRYNQKPSNYLLYDYSQPTFTTPPTPSTTTIPHILELKNLSDTVTLQDTRLDVLKKAGATLKIIEEKNIVLAIFKNAASAKHALDTISSNTFELKPFSCPT